MRYFDLKRIPFLLWFPDYFLLLRQSSQVFSVWNYVPNSWKNHVNYQFGGNCPNVRSVHGDGRVGFDDPRDNHVADDLLVYDPKKPSRILQRYDASLGDGAGYSFEVTTDHLQVLQSVCVCVIILFNMKKYIMYIYILEKFQLSGIITKFQLHVPCDDDKLP